MARALDQHGARFDRGVENRRHVDALPPQLDRSARDPRHVQQVLHQASHVLRLAVDDTGRPLQLLRTGRPGAQDLYGVADGSERVPQLVREQGEKLVLALVGLAELTLRPLLVGDVARDLGRADQLSGLVADRRNGQRYVEQASVLCDADGFEVISALTPAQPGKNHLLFALAVIRNDQQNGPADRLGRGVAEQTLGTAVPRRNDAVERLADDGVVRGRDDRREQLLRWEWSERRCLIA